VAFALHELGFCFDFEFVRVRSIVARSLFTMGRCTYMDIVAQITSATLAGDIVLTAAYAHELPRYGLKGGLTFYAAGTGNLQVFFYLTSSEFFLRSLTSECVCI